MKLAYPDALWGLWLIPILAIVLALDGQRRRRILERIGHLAQIRRMTESVSLGRRRLKSVALVLGIAAAVMSLARPQRAGVAHVLPRRGLDIVVALDFSKSMLAADVYPTRLARAKYELARLIDGLKGDRVGLVAFAGVTLSYPLTSDYAAAKLFWRDLGPDDIPVGGTNLGDAIKAALELLQYGHPQQGAGDERPPARILILLTDGADTEGAALAAAREAKKLGVKVFTVGIGSREGEVVVLKRKDDGTAEYITDPLGAPIRMALDETTLREIAKLTDGKYFQVDPERFGVDMVQSAIASEERQEEGHRFVVEPAEAYVWFLAPAFALLALEAFASDRKRRKKKPAPTEEAIEDDDSALQKKRGPGVKRRRRPGAMAASFLLFFMLPMLGGWTGFKRLSPAVKEGNERLAAGKADEALAAYDRALVEQPEDLSLHFNRGGALYALGKFPEAQREFLRATEAGDPSLKADAYYNMGNALLRQTLPKESIEAYKQALRLRPDDRRAKWNLELALKLLEKQDEEKQKQSKDDQKKDDKNDDKKDQDKQDQKQNDQKNDKQDSKDQKQAGNDQQKPPPEGDKKQDDKKQDDKKQAENDKKQDDKKQDDKKQDEKKQDDKKQAENDKKQGDKTQDEKKSGSPEEKKEQEKQGEKKQDEKQAENEKKPEGDAKDGQPKQAQAGTGKARDIDKQDAEAVLDAFERVEPTVQKDLARRKAKNRRPRKDW